MSAVVAAVGDKLDWIAVFAALALTFAGMYTHRRRTSCPIETSACGA